MTTGSSSGPQILWDPFCGVGMIPCVALAAFPGKFNHVVGSDINPDACMCAQKNMRIVTDVSAFETRRREIHRRRGMNRGMNRRWAVVERYMERIQPILLGSTGQPAPVSIRCDAFSLPAAVTGNLHFVSDLPQNKTSHLHGGHLGELLPSLRAAYPLASITFVATNDSVGELSSSGLVSECRRLAGGRVIVRA